MSEERKKRKQERERLEQPPKPLLTRKRIITIVVIVLAFAVVAAIAHYQSHRYDAFAKCLADRHVVMYGAYWCPHCSEQKEKFGAAFEHAPYVECGVQGNTRAEQQVCKDAGIKHFPTWQFPPTGEREERVFSLQELSDRTGCSLP
jgi:hypothetical protein